MKSLKARRIIAVFIDYLFLALINLVIFYLLKLFAIFDYTSQYYLSFDEFVPNYAVSLIITLVIIIGYYVVIPYLQNGSTFGKQIMRIKVTATNGRASLVQLFLRNIPTMVAIIMLVAFFVNPYQAHSSISSYGSPVGIPFISGYVGHVYGITALFRFVEVAITVTVLITIIKSGGDEAINDKIAKTQVELL